MSASMQHLWEHPITKVTKINQMKKMRGILLQLEIHMCQP